jgi:phosphate uptake regulator
MKRSIIQLGGKTSVISLPQHWVEKLGLKKKDEVEVTERGEELIVSPQKNQSNKVIKIKLSAKDKRFIRNLFLILGSLAYDEVEIEVNNREIMSLLHETAQTFSSFVLVEQDKTRCVYRTVSKESKEDFDYILEKCFNVTQSLADNFLEIIKEGNYKDLKTLSSFESTNNQLTTMGERILIKSGYKDQDKTCFVYLLLWNLEVIADFYRRACYFLAENTKKGFKLSKKLVELIGKANLLLNKLSHLPKKSPVQDFIDLFALKAEIGDEMESIFKSGKYEEIIIGHYVMDIITYVQDCSIAYLGVLYGKEDGETDK